MSKVVTLISNSSALISNTSGYLGFNDHSSAEAILTDQREINILAKFPPLSGDDVYREILACDAVIYCRSEPTDWPASIFVRALSEPFNVNTVTGASYNSLLSGTPGFSFYSYQITDIGSPAYRSVEIKFYPEIKSAIATGIGIDSYESDYHSEYAQTAYGKYPPKLEVHLGELRGMSVIQLEPKSGWHLDYAESCDFTLSVKTDSKVSVAPISLESAVLQWRVKGQTAINSISLDVKDVEAGKVTIPGNTFSTGDIDYRFVLTANSGAVTNGVWVSLVSPQIGEFAYVPRSGARLNRSIKNSIYAAISADPWQGNASLFRCKNGELRWRIKGNGSYNTIPFSWLGTLNFGAAVPANTFPSGEIECQIYGETTNGLIAEGQWIVFDTRDTVSTARTISPIGSVEDGMRAILMQWEHINESGAAATKSEIQIARPGEEFSELVIIDGNALQYSAPAKTFASGEWRWRVRTYNIDGVAGAWSDEGNFVVIASPTTPVLVLEGEGPRPEIRWQTNEQEGYELELDGVSLGTRFGAVQRWKSPDYLSDGQHSFRVRVQNVYGLWSEWGVLMFPVSNEAGPEISLQGSGSRQAELQWQAAGYDFYIIYRNGVPIGKTSGTAWVDLFAIDRAKYIVRGCYSDSSNYGESRELVLDVLPESIIIQAVDKLDSEDWISLRLSHTQHRVIKSARGRTVNLVQLIGAYYPIAEPEDAQSLSIQISCAFKHREECRVLEELVGKLVCVKTQHGEMAIGYLQNLNKNGEEFYSSYSFTVQHLEWQEGIDIDA